MYKYMQCRFHDLEVNTKAIQETFFNVYVYVEKFLGIYLWCFFLPSFFIRGWNKTRTFPYDKDGGDV